MRVPQIYDEFESPIIESKVIDLDYFEGRYENQYQFVFNGKHVVTFYVKDAKGNVEIKEIELTVQDGLISGAYNGDQLVCLKDAILVLQVQRI